MTRRPLIGMCFGTVNRRSMLERCIASIRRAAGNTDVKIFIADGGSTDGTLPYLYAQPDVVVIEQGELLGGTRAFNAAYAAALADGREYIGTFNDDIEFDGTGAPELERAAARLADDDALGAIAFTSDRFRTPADVNDDPFQVAFLPGGKPITFRVELHHGRPYMNQGLAKRAAHMAVARAQGDPTGCNYWDPAYHTYGADSASGCWMWRLGWRIDAAEDLRVHEHLPGFVNPFTDDGCPTDNYGEADTLRARNVSLADASTAHFVREWSDPARLEYSREDAMRFGGRLL